MNLINYFTWMDWIDILHHHFLKSTITVVGTMHDVQTALECTCKERGRMRYEKGRQRERILVMTYHIMGG